MFLVSFKGLVKTNYPNLQSDFGLIPYIFVLQFVVSATRRFVDKMILF